MKGTAIDHLRNANIPCIMQCLTQDWRVYHAVCDSFSTVFGASQQSLAINHSVDLGVARDKFLVQGR